MLKWIYTEIKDTIFDLKNDIENLFKNIYYGYFRNDVFSKGYVKYDFLKIGGDIKNPFRHTWYGIKNIYRWWMVIWEDRDFDYIYMEKILSHKLKTMEDFFLGDETHIEDAVKYGNEIKRCHEILESLVNDTYSDEIYKEYYDKYPHDENFFNFEPCDSEKERIEQGLPARLYEMKNNDTNEQKELFRACSDKAEIKKNELRKELYDTLRDKSEWWWD